MTKSLKSFLKKIEANNSDGATEGFRVLNNIRGGKLLSVVGTNQNSCQNDGTCSGTNANICSNNRCADATNTGCSNYGSCFA